MSDRTFRVLNTQGIQHVQENFVVLPQGSSMPLLGEGALSSSVLPTGMTGTNSAGGLSVVRGASGVTGVTGVTGTYIIYTQPFTAVVGCDCNFQFNTKQSGAWVVEFSPPVQQSNGQWAVPFTTFQSGVATDVPANPNNKLFIQLTMRNGPNKP